jgi:NSS family neurotransmitter:Na+ symporter
MKPNKDFFSSRLGFILSLVGIAVGAGNIWRFSRIVAQNGGGSFLVPWLLFLVTWSIPLIIGELALGKLTRKAPIGALAQTAGRSFGWMGAFICLVTTGILFYYSVIVGWGFQYFGYAIQGVLTNTDDYRQLWTDYSQSYQPLITHFIAMILGAFVVYKGVAKGIEKSNKILIPTLLVMIGVIAVRALTLPGAFEGVKYLFTPNLSDLCNVKIWIEALTQNAWDTGAGWGLLLVYANYARKDESVNTNGILTALINNGVSLLMAVIIFSAAFALGSHAGLSELQTQSNVGLTFIYLPQLFSALPGSALSQVLFASLFFLAFAFGALSSMISMIQVAVKSIHELGVPYKASIVIVTVLSLLLGAPSALSMAIFENQDWVWSLALIVNGLFIAFAIARFGIDRFRVCAINSAPNDIKMGRFYNWMIAGVIPVQGIILISWYFYQSFCESGLNPFHIYSLGSLLLQWGVALVFFVLLNKWLVQKTAKHTIAT